MIWLKRILPVVIIAAVLLGHRFYTKNKTGRMEKETERYAMVTAKVWVGSALFRNEPEKFLLYRDSILKENSVSSEEMRKYLEIYQSKSEKYERFTEMVSEYVDSLCLINEKLLSVDSMLDIDSVEGEPGS